MAARRGMRALFGDQTLFCRASDFRSVGGFDERLRIMEDLDLVIRLHAAGPSGRPGTETEQHASAQASSLSAGPSIREHAVPFASRVRRLEMEAVRMSDAVGVCPSLNARENDCHGGKVVEALAKQVKASIVRAFGAAQTDQYCKTRMRQIADRKLVKPNPVCKRLQDVE